MSYLVNQTRVASLVIGGVDYTSSMVEWTVSDESAMKNGCIQTSGTLVLGSRPGGAITEDYDRDHFRRGTVVTLDVTEPGGAPYRHPRGYLHVITTSYDVEGEQLRVELGCRLVLMALTEEIDELVAITPISLDIAQTTYSNCSAAFASKGMYVFQDNTGALTSGEFFSGDGYDSVAPGEWISVLGVTATSVAPLQGSGAVPDIVELSYQVPADGLNEDGKGRVDTVTTDSYYFTRYPAMRFKRNGYTRNLLTGEIGYKTPVWVETITVQPQPSSSVGCGNQPPPTTNESGYWTLVCLENWETVQENVYVPVTSQQIATTTYDGPGAQVSRQFQEFYGPAIEANGQHYADRYAYCRSINAVRCLPDGNCPMEGLERVLLGYSTVVNYYGSANELIRTVTDTYSTTLSAAQPNDWRSGMRNGVPQDFQRLSPDQLFRVGRVDTTYYQEGSSNVQKDVTYQSVATARGTGLSGNIDALNGIVTTQIRKSTTSATVEIAPDRVNSATTSTEEKSTSIVLFSGRYTSTPSETGPYIAQEQIPVPLLFANQSEIDSTVVAYSNYLERFIKGDSFGLQIAEGLRSDVSTGWRPGMPFRYYDPSKDKVLAMRMDATAWGVGTDESAFVTNGVWLGTSNGSVTLPRNLRGDSRPDMGSGGGPATDVVPPAIDDETFVDSGAFAWKVDVHFGTAANAVTFGNDGVIPSLPASYSETPQLMTGIMVTGVVVGPGDLLETENNGRVPLEDNGNLITVDATIVTEDLFA
jgi:hypothetical protein